MDILLANPRGFCRVDVDRAIGMSEVHTCQEFIKVADLELSARLVEALIEQA